MTPSVGIRHSPGIGCWQAWVGMELKYGTREECLLWLCEQNAILIDLARAVQILVFKEGISEPPCHGERRSS